MTLLIDPALLPDLARGQPVLLLAPGVWGTDAVALPGLVPCGIEATEAEGGLRLHVPGTDPARAAMPLPCLPAGLLALVAPSRARAAPLLAALAEAAPEAPPLIEATDAAAALPELARLALAATAADRARLGELRLALAELRQEAEETREAMVAMLQGMGYQAPPQPPRLALSAEPSPTLALAAAPEEGGMVLGQALGVTLEGVAALAVHLAEAPRSADGSALRLRLYGAESGRIFASWLVPAEAGLAPGWLTLDLPAPLGPVRETACLDLRADLVAGDRLAFSLEDRISPADRAVRVAGVAKPGDRALALRLWTAPFGRRFVLAPHWVAEEVELPLLPLGAPAGAPVRLPTQIWSAALLPEGRVERVALGAEPARLVATLGGGESCLIALPAVPVTGLDLLQAEVSVALGDAALLEAALWLQPAGTAPVSEADLSPAAPGARWSGWRRAGPAGGPLRIGLRLPLEDGVPMLGVVLALRNLGGGPADLLRVEWADLTGTRLAERLPAGAAAPAHRSRPAAPALPRLPEGEVPQLGAVRLHEHYATPDGGYRHLDIGVEAMRIGGFAWPRLRFKFAMNGEEPVLEFRSRPDWPLMFEAWPGQQADEFGPLLRIGRPDLAGAFPARLRSERDRWMLLALIRLLPAVVATAAREAVSDPEDYEAWLGLARRLAEALPREAG